jgi:uridine kinase
MMAQKMKLSSVPFGIRPTIVAIVGGSGSGKTWLARELQRRLGRKAGILSLDDFYRDLTPLSEGERERVNFDHPAAIDWKLLAVCLGKIQRGERALLPRYNFVTHTRRSSQRNWHPRPIVLVDGLWLLRRSEVRRLFSIKVFVQCPNRLRMARRVARDVRERGRTADAVRRQFRDRVEPMRERFVEPQRRWASCCIASPATEAALRALLDKIRAADQKTADQTSPRL